MLWIGGVVLVAMFMIAVFSLVWRRLRRSAGRNDPVFTLEELRRLRDRGDVTIAEYEALKETVLKP